MFDRRNNLSQAVAEDVRACLGDGGVRHGRAAQRALVGGAEPRPAGADLRPQMPGLRGLYPPRARADRRACRSWRRRHERRAGERAWAWACQALLGEAAAPRRAGAEARRAAACAKSRSRGSGPIPTSRASSSTRTALDELAESIAERGVLQPILLRPEGDGFQIVAGERRWRAAQRAGLHAHPGDRPRRIDEAATAELALIENIQREDLNALEEAEGYRQLINRYGHTQDEVGRTGPQVAQPCHQPVEIARSSGVREAIAIARRYQYGSRAGGRGGAGPRGSDPRHHCQGAVGAPGRAARQGAPSGGAARAGPDRRRGAVDADIAALERQLGDMLGLKVEVANKGKGGTVIAALFEPRSARHDLPAAVGRIDLARYPVIARRRRRGNPGLCRWIAAPGSGPGSQ